MKSLKTLNVDNLCDLCQGMTKEQVHDFLVAQKKSGCFGAPSERIGNILSRVLRPNNMTIEELREDSPIEDVMARELRFNHISYKRKSPVGKYELDFAIEYNGLFLDVECDGHNFHAKDYQQVERDRKRDKFMASKGWITLRFSGSQIVQNPAQCVNRIKTVLGVKDILAKTKGGHHETLTPS